MSQQDEVPLGDWVAETHESIAARLEGVKTAQAQTRLTLGTMAIISVMMLIASYNAYLSYDYDWLVERNCPEATARELWVNSEYVQAKREKLVRQVGEERARIIEERNNTLTDHAMKEWASSRTVMVSLLGIRVSVDDVSVLGTAVLFVLSLWLFLVARRENHTTGFLLRDTDSSPPEPASGASGAQPAGGKPRLYSNGERWLIYHTIISNSLFVTFDHMPNVDQLSGPNSLEAAVAEAERMRLKRLGLNIARGFFFWFPAVIAAGVCLLDLTSYFRWDPFAFGCEPDGATWDFWRSATTFAVCFIPLLICCWKSSRLAARTERVLREYGENLLRNLKEQQRLLKG